MTFAFYVLLLIYPARLVTDVIVGRYLKCPVFLDQFSWHRFLRWALTLGARVLMREHLRLDPFQLGFMDWSESKRQFGHIELEWIHGDNDWLQCTFAGIFITF